MTSATRIGDIPFSPRSAVRALIPDIVAGDGSTGIGFPP